MISTLIRFSLKLWILMVSLYWAHSLFIDHLGFTIPVELLKSCYIFNAFITLVFLLILLIVSKNQPSILGWVFLMTSGLKFLLFLVMIYPSFRGDISESKSDFFTFFVPYVAALSLEIYQLVKILNKEK